MHSASAALSGVKVRMQSLRRYGRMKSAHAWSESVEMMPLIVTRGRDVLGLGAEPVLASH